MELRTILVISDFAVMNGGQAKVAIDSARLLAEAGYEVIFFAALGPADPALIHPRIRVELLDQPDMLSDPNRLRAMIRGLWNRKARARLEAVLGRCDPAQTLMHCHGFAKALSPAIGPVLTRPDWRVVFTMHEYFLACPNGGFYDYRRGEICHRHPLGPACLASNCDMRRASHKAWRVLRQIVARGPGRLPGGLRDVIFISQTQRRVMAPYLPPGARLHHVPNPITLPDLEPVRASANDIFLFVGRLSPEKGAVQFAKAARIGGVRARFVGDGPEAAKIRAQNPDAELVGWVSPQTVQDELSRARALVFPSLWYEGQPLVPLEAMARGVPVIAGNWSAAAEAVRPGETGLLYDRPDAETLARSLVAARGLPDFDPAPLQEELSPARHLARLLGVYREMGFALRCEAEGRSSESGEAMPEAASC
ncbi:glycosyltransferase family 4 protein [Thioclava atlantica]|uniref:Group 1 glycosyl transferase n=1 Tax=Thioclava atlantica TaxID=1317124 RepID=A0A085TXX8_9RHOB|nr:glycosyltransferase family 4 protein [Thioclava atlantica]KFE35575.1 group 1 glycosyl transferase [Thioclava atlantica]